jgi:hypothetical protein
VAGGKGTAIIVPINLKGSSVSKSCQISKSGILKQTIFHNHAICPYYLSATSYKPLNLQIQVKKFFTHDQQKKYPG